MEREEVRNAFASIKRMGVAPRCLIARWKALREDGQSAASEAASRRVRAAASTRRQQRAARVALALVAARSARADLGEGLCNSIARAPVAALGHCLLS